MKLSALRKVLSPFLVLLLFFSCASDLDYDQANDIKLEPVLIANLAYFDVQANEFVTNGLERSMIKDVQTIDVFNDEFFRKSLKKVEFFLEMENTVNRAYTVNLEFLDRNSQAVYTTNFTIPAYAGVENKVIRTEIFENTRLDLLKRTTKIAFTLQMLPGALLTENSLGNLKLRSDVTAYLVVE